MLGHARYFKKGHEIAKADRKHRWIRTGSGSITPIQKICQDGRRRGEVHGRQQVDNMSVLEKMHYHRQNTSVEYIRMRTSAQLGQDPTNLELQEEDHF